ncbi:LysR substrate-binding domain-containing protein [Agrobacterium tumefaciens]|uniref:LysR family transcriptional regulator n=1 Tax=Agrobacterium tumefaciens TaxID=358 RepID=UPI003AF7A6DC
MLDELDVFIAVAETGSFAEAAKRLSRDASVLSRRMSQLEKRLGVQLLSRTTRSVVLTEVGTTYLRRVRSAMDEIASAEQEASNSAASPQGLLRVSLPVTFGRLWIAPLLSGFLREYSNIRIDARFSDRYVDVVAEGYDVAIRVGTLRDSSLTARKISSYRNLLLASPAYLEEHGEPSRPEELAAHACLGFTNNASWPDWDFTLKTSRKRVRVTGPLIADNSETLLSAAIDGLGIILTPDWLAGPAIKEGKLVEILPGTTGAEGGAVFAVMPPGRLIPTKTKVFVDAVVRVIKVGWAA